MRNLSTSEETCRQWVILSRFNTEERCQTKCSVPYKNVMFMGTIFDQKDDKIFWALILVTLATSQYKYEWTRVKLFIFYINKNGVKIKFSVNPVVVYTGNCNQLFRRNKLCIRLDPQCRKIHDPRTMDLVSSLPSWGLGTKWKDTCVIRLVHSPEETIILAVLECKETQTFGQTKPKPKNILWP